MAVCPGRGPRAGGTKVKRSTLSACPPFETNSSFRLVAGRVGRRCLRGRWLRHRCLARRRCRLGDRLMRGAGSQHDARENGKQRSNDSKFFHSRNGLCCEVWCRPSLSAIVVAMIVLLIIMTVLPVVPALFPADIFAVNPVPVARHVARDPNHFIVAVPIAGAMRVEWPVANLD